MKRVVTGPNGIMTVYGNEHLTDDDLKLIAAELALEKESVVRVMRKMLYRNGGRPVVEAGKDA